MNSARPADPSVEYIPILDGLRAVSIGLVLAGHVLLRDRPSSGLADFGFMIASYGVSVFFVISGYLITRLLLGEERRRGSVNLVSFYVRRGLRLFPALYAYILAIGVLNRIGLIRDMPWHDYIASLFYVRNIFGHAHETTQLWSLALEEQFYFLWPTAFVVLAARRRLSFVALAVVVFTAWRAFLIATGRTNFAKLIMRPDQRMDTILIGCGLALLVGGRQFERWSVNVFETRWFAGLMAAATVAWLVFVESSAAVGAIRHTTTAVLIAAGIHCLLRNPGSIASTILATRPMLYVGRLSYSLYLWHGLFMVERTPEMDAVRRFPLDLTLSVGCALGSFYLIERPFLQLKNRRFQ